MIRLIYVNHKMTLNDFDFVLFGGSGDLAMRKLLPALFSCGLAGSFPDTARIICIGRNDWKQEDFHREIDKNAKTHLKKTTLNTCS